MWLGGGVWRALRSDFLLLGLGFWCTLVCKIFRFSGIFEKAHGLSWGIGGFREFEGFIYFEFANFVGVLLIE